MISIKVILILLASIPSFAGSPDFEIVEGRVDKMEGEKITLLVQGKPVVVPRSSIPKHESIAPNKVVTAYIPSKGAKKK